MISELIYESLIDSARMIPFLLMIYIGIELFEYKFGNSIKKLVQKAAGAGPFAGAIAGAFPQCGFSVMATALYTQRLATIGTLLAVYISTSDEAIPIMMSYPDGYKLLIPFIATKIFIGTAAGYFIDLAFRKENRLVLSHIEAVQTGADEVGHHHELISDEVACCGHIADSTSKKFNPRQIILHPILHTLKIFAFIFIISFSFGLAMDSFGRSAVTEWFAAAALFQPLIAALIGLIPNCAASVLITELYLGGAISYGAALAGLCASGGLGLLVLAREEKDKKKVIIIVVMLFGISVLAGYATQLLQGG